MKRMMMFCVLMLVLFAGQARAQDIAGRWQATLHDTQDYRIVLVVEKTKDKKLSADFYWPDDHTFFADTTLPLHVASISQEDSSFKFALGPRRSYVGTISADGNAITGTWTQPGGPVPLTFQRATGKAVWVLDRSPHKISFVTVDKNVRLEVLDWVGSGPPLVLLPGGGDTAHVFDKFALNFTSNHHVYAITPRGFGVSSWPAPTTENYAADRLGDDVLAVISTLKIDRPVIAGHSAEGAALSSIGSRYPQKVSGLIYLDAGFPYSLYTPANLASLNVDAEELRKKLGELEYAQTMGGAISDLAEMLPQFEKEVTFMQKRFAAAGFTPPKPGTIFVPTREDEVKAAMTRGERKYTEINCPLLAIFAIGPDDDATVGEEAKAFAALQNAKVVKLANAQHYVFLSNEADVIREMNAFMDGLR